MSSSLLVITVTVVNYVRNRKHWESKLISLVVTPMTTQTLQNWLVLPQMVLTLSTFHHRMPSPTTLLRHSLLTTRKHTA